MGTPACVEILIVLVDYMTYNRQRCNPETTQPTYPQANDYCLDNPANPPGLLPTGYNLNERLSVGFFYCDGRVNPFPERTTPFVGQPGLLGYRNQITDELSFDLNVRNVQTSIDVPGQPVPNNFGGLLDVCLP